MFKKGIHTILILCMGPALFSQSAPTLLGKMSFEQNLLVSSGEAPVDERAVRFNGSGRAMAPGIEGLAVDFSASSDDRRSIRLPVTHGHLSSFTVKIWVRTEPGAPLAHAIASNRSSRSDSTMGWTISTQPNGSWMWTASDGSMAYEYAPTVGRQPINDGQWHQLAFSVDYEARKARMYYDGSLVATYHIGDLGSLTRDLPIFIGSMVSFDRSEMATFNGCLDEFELWSGILPSGVIEDDYLKYFPSKRKHRPTPPSELKVLAWNIWHGGREHGSQVGVQRVIDVIRGIDPDVICMIETYGSGPQIADAFGYHFYLRSSNLSIMSKFPFDGFIDVFRPFNCGGVYLDIGDGRNVAVVNTWLHYLPDYRKAMRDDQAPAEEIFVNEGETRYTEIMEILDELKPVIRDANNIPLIMAGDFNTPSHLDFTKQLADKHWGYILEWPVTREIEQSGLKDSFREIHPDPGTNYGGTQPSDIFDTFHFRIDYIFYRGKDLIPVDSRVIRTHPVKFPSDHNAVFTIFKISE